jgi:hypothetical protein
VSVAPSFADRVQETTATTGTGTLNLAGAVIQFQSFVAGVGSGKTVYYCILAGNGTDWEVGIGTVTSGSPNTLSRDIVLASSNSGSLVSLTGTSTVFGDAPAAFLAYGSGLFAGLLGSQESSAQPPSAANTGLSTWYNQGSSTTSDTAAGILISAPGVASGNDLVGRYKTAPSAPYTITALLAVARGLQASPSTIALGWFTSSSGEAEYVAVIPGDGGSSILEGQAFSGPNTFGASLFANPIANPPQPTWLQIADDGTDIHMRTSADGVNFIELYSEAKSGGHISNYDNVGFMVNDGTSTPVLGTLMAYRES